MRPRIHTILNLHASLTSFNANPTGLSIGFAPRCCRKYCSSLATCEAIFSVRVKGGEYRDRFHVKLPNRFCDECFLRANVGEFNTPANRKKLETRVGRKKLDYKSAGLFSISLTQ